MKKQHQLKNVKVKTKAEKLKTTIDKDRTGWTGSI